MNENGRVREEERESKGMPVENELCITAVAPPSSITPFLSVSLTHISCLALEVFEITTLLSRLCDFI